MRGVETVRSKRFEYLDQRPVNQDGYAKEWPEVGFIAMNSPFDPTPSIKIVNGEVVEMDGKQKMNSTCLTHSSQDMPLILTLQKKQWLQTLWRLRVC